jgi:hypothetical protein
MDGFWHWASSIPWFAWVAIVAILAGCATSVATAIIKHREKMERIRFGDQPRRED